MVAIDALIIREYSHQFKMGSVLREINKVRSRTKELFIEKIRSGHKLVVFIEMTVFPNVMSQSKFKVIIQCLNIRNLQRVIYHTLFIAGVQWVLCTSL